jgi:hypothetical protein
LNPFDSQIFNFASDLLNTARFLLTLRRISQLNYNSTARENKGARTRANVPPPVNAAALQTCTEGRSTCTVSCTVKYYTRESMMECCALPGQRWDSRCTCWHAGSTQHAAHCTAHCAAAMSTIYRYSRERYRYLYIAVQYSLHSSAQCAVPSSIQCRVQYTVQRRSPVQFSSPVQQSSLSYRYE